MISASGKSEIECIKDIMLLQKRCMAHFLYKTRISISKASETVPFKNLAFVKFQLPGNILGTTHQEESGLIKGHTEESNMKHHSSGKCDLPGKAGEEISEQGFDKQLQIQK